MLTSQDGSLAEWCPGDPSTPPGEPSKDPMGGIRDWPTPLPLCSEDGDEALRRCVVTRDSMEGVMLLLVDLRQRELDVDLSSEEADEPFDTTELGDWQRLDMVSHSTVDLQQR
jgi:hypothetical protein